MIPNLIWLTAVIVLIAMGVAFSRTRDPLHPLVFIGPMLLYVHAFAPGVFFYQGDLARWLPDEAGLHAAVTYTMLGVASFCLGCLRPRVPRGAAHLLRIPMSLSPRTRARLATASYILACWGLAAFLYRIALAGGLVGAYDTPKGGGARVASGYLSVAPLLTIPAIMLFLLSRHGYRLTGKTAVLLLVFVSPHLIQGLLGGSRGPTFLAFATLVFAWYLATGKRPPLRITVPAVVAIGFLLMFLKFHRQELYLGSEKEMRQATLREIVLPTGDESRSHVSIYSLAMIMVSRHSHFYGWGRTYLVQFFVRPIPRQWWPTKYEDAYKALGMEITGSGYELWPGVVGWIPNAGSAAGFVPDSFTQFAWGGLVVCFLMGWLYGFLWKQAVLLKGIWSIWYFESCVVSVYLPTQGLASAWGYRFLYLAIPSSILWYLVIGRRRRAPFRRGTDSMPIPRLDPVQTPLSYDDSR